MVTEVAEIEVKPGLEAEFEKGVAEAKPLFLRARGCSGVRLERSIEKPQRYLLLVQWATVENHTVDFRLSGFRTMARIGRPLLRERARGHAYADRHRVRATVRFIRAQIHPEKS